ncbi:uncharacterized protein CcaverHIS019_0103250 [Cutaneotrichosporon cavernicola]|uniref:Uncharacterized protein n=1 Tax=Cutaneotrichosporon cavernicola TaxID=279322 RepID=A0AA48L0I5_9TREE|nr:uncharacterized protein CcaverHIS019_0103250 [Cutaneotrichosporon cavernicola]BEI87607.1 hypothetical protein CcaverHIS019_0103250 [Cutaneotrichosporon cavernicola]BEI95378.1 hypothetical protein CcaverHIS631_0103270 [Cutaneotrichosporon cavernicola]
MTWPSWLACLCDLWQPTPEKQGILECSPSSGSFLPPPITSQPTLRTRPIEYLYTLLAPAQPPPYGTGQLHHDASSVGSAPSIIQQADTRHKERMERQRIEAETRDKTNAARNKITSAYGSRMLKVGLVYHNSVPPIPPFPIADDETVPLYVSSHPVSDEAPAQPSGGRVDLRSPTHLSYGTFGTFAPPVPEAGYPGLGIGFPAGPPAMPKMRRPVRPVNGLTVQVPAVPLGDVRRHVAEMLFNIRGDDTDESHPPSPLARTDSRYSIDSRRSHHSMDSPRSLRFPGVVVTPAYSEDTSPSASTSHIPLTPTNPKTPATPASAVYFAHHPSIEPPLSAAKYRRHSDEIPRAYRLSRDITTLPPRLERTRSDTPPRGRQRARGTPRSRRDSISTHTDDTQDGVVYKQIGLSGLPGRKRHILRKKTRFEA